jgi:MFS family permease
MGEAATPGNNRAWLGFLAIGLAVLTPAMDTSVNIAMPAITQAFALGQRDIQWVVTCYMLVNGALMLTCGKLGDLHGHRRVLQSGLLLITFAFIACTLAETYLVLLAGRALQGVGMALTLSCAPALVTSLYPASQRTRLLGIYGAIFAFGGAMGPIAGSWLVAFMGWSGVFAFRAPIALAALALSVFLPRSASASGPRDRSDSVFDRLGAILLVVWMGALMLACAGPHDVAAVWPLKPAWLPDGARLGWLLAGIGAAGLALFLWHEARLTEPIIRPAVFKSLPFSVLNGLCLTVNLTNFSVLLLVPYFLRQGLYYPLDLSGFLLGLGGAGAMVGSWTTGRLARRFSVLGIAFTGAAITGFGLLLIAQWENGMQAWVVAGTLLLQGFGMGLFQVAYNDSVIAALPVEDRGVAGSLTMMVRTLGILGGATGLSALLLYFTQAAAMPGTSADTAYRIAFCQSLTTAGLVVLTATALACLLLKSRRHARAPNGDAH